VSTMSPQVGSRGTASKRRYVTLDRLQGKNARDFRNIRIGESFGNGERFRGSLELGKSATMVSSILIDMTFKGSTGHSQARR